MKSHTYTTQMPSQISIMEGSCHVKSRGQMCFSIQWHDLLCIVAVGIEHGDVSMVMYPRTMLPTHHGSILFSDCDLQHNRC